MTTEWDTWQRCTSVCAKPEVGISPHSLCEAHWVNIYNSERRISRWRRKCSSVCALISVSVWGKRVETYEILQAALGESCLSRSNTFEWYYVFKIGRRSFVDDPRPGRPSTSHTEETVARVREIIRADRRLTISDVSEEVRIAYGRCQKTPTEDLRMRCVTAKFVPRLLTAEQKDDRLSFCTDLRDRA